MNNMAQMCRTVRKDIIETLANAGCGHPGGSLSSVEIAVELFFEKMNIDPNKPAWEDRDRFILSKGHATLLYYSVLAERGFFPKEELVHFRQNWGMLPGHPDMRKIPGVDMTSGSLGQGLAVANGMAMAGRLQNKNYYVYVLMGDGEQQEGMVWEAAMASAHYGLDHIIAFVDENGLQLDGATKDIMNVESIADKYRSFNWHVQEINGHDLEAISKAVDTAKKESGVPSVIIARTVKGKGISFMENKVEYHGKAITQEQAVMALEELEGEQ